MANPKTIAVVPAISNDSSLERLVQAAIPIITSRFVYPQGMLMAWKLFVVAESSASVYPHTSWCSRIAHFRHSLRSSWSGAVQALETLRSESRALPPPWNSVQKANGRYASHSATMAKKRFSQSEQLSVAV
jgi:hypothetical protein